MALQGNETLLVLGTQANGMPAATTFQTTTGAIAALASSEGVGETAFTAITTVGNGTLTAAAVIGGGISRSGPVGAFSDATDTAAAIVAAITAAFIGQSFYLRIKNLTAFTQTITAGAGVTLTGAVLIPPNFAGTYLVTLTSLSAVTFFHVSTGAISGDTPEVITTLSTVGAGTITGAGIAGGITSRTGAQTGTPFTDTTDTAAAIISGRINARIGQMWEYTYVNTTNAVATLAGGTGVTPSGITAIPAGYAVKYLVTYTAAATITMVAISVAQAATSEQSLILAGSTSGTTTLVATATAGSTTQTLPAVTGTTASTTGSNLFVTDVYRSSASVTANATVTPATITGLAGAVVVGTYRFRAVLPSTVASGTGGIAYNFLLTTAVLSSIQYGATMLTSTVPQYTQGTTATSGTVVATQAAVVLQTILEGTFVVSTGGTFTLQMAQNTSNASNSVTLIGSSMELCRIA